MNTLAQSGLRPLDVAPRMRALALAVLLGAITGAPLAAQQQSPADSALPAAASSAAQAVTRAQLRARLDSLKALPADSAGIVQAARIERRLTQGDFQPGDIVQVSVWGDSALSGNFTVTPTRTLEIPGIPPIDLRGVLYSEADSVVARGLSSLLRNPRVTVHALTRVAVLGAVKNPGFYDLAPTSSVADALMAAGGPVQRANLDDLQLMRNGQNLLSSDEQKGKVTNLTLADLGVERGDQLLVPSQGNGLDLRLLLGGIGALIGVTYGITRIIRGH